MDTIKDLIARAQEELWNTREIYPWYSREVTDLEARLVILEEVRDAMIENGEE